MENFDLVDKYVDAQFPDCRDKDDLKQIGRIALLDAETRFDGSRGVEFKTYAYHYVSGRIKTYWRKEHNKEILFSDIDVEELPYEDYLDEKIDYDIIITGLEREDRDIINKRFREGWSFQEIGNYLGVSRQMAHKRLKRIIKNLKERHNEKENL